MKAYIKSTLPTCNTKRITDDINIAKLTKMLLQKVNVI